MCLFKDEILLDRKAKPCEMGLKRTDEVTNIVNEEQFIREHKNKVNFENKMKL
jgi:hypothetical protein